VVEVSLVGTCPSSAKNRFVAAFAQGLLNFICYGLNDKLKQAWLQVRRQQPFPSISVCICCHGPETQTVDANSVPWAPYCSYTAKVCYPPSGESGGSCPESSARRNASRVFAAIPLPPAPSKPDAEVARQRSTGCSIIGCVSVLDARRATRGLTRVLGFVCVCCRTRR